jgi:hypothetical protein
VINCNTTRRDVMLRAGHNALPVGAHPFWYARVLGIYHANVYFGDRFESHPQRIDFMFVRWFKYDLTWQGGPGNRRLDRLSWVPGHSSRAFGFLDPACVVRACHLVPEFARGLTTCLLGPSQMRDLPSGDWANHYVSRYVRVVAVVCVRKAKPD